MICPTFKVIGGYLNQRITRVVQTSAGPYSRGFIIRNTFFKEVESASDKPVGYRFDQVLVFISLEYFGAKVLKFGQLGLVI